MDGRKPRISAKVSPPAGESYTEPYYYYVYDYNGTDVAAAKLTDNYATYGVLYDWTAAKAACPTGWHLPSDDEWKQLEIFIGMRQSEADVWGYRGTNEGDKLKATSGWMNNGFNTDTFGFSALPGGYRDTNGLFNRIGESGCWWTATVRFDDFAWFRGMYDNHSKVILLGSYKGTGYSVRCVRD